MDMKRKQEDGLGCVGWGSDARAAGWFSSLSRTRPPVWLGKCSAILSLLALCSLTARADKSFEAWSAADATRKKVGELRRSDPKAAAQTLEQALQQVTDSNVAADFFSTLGDVYTDDLKEPDRAIAVFERALPLFQKPENKVPVYHYLTMVGAKSKALLAAKRLADAEALLKENAPRLAENGQHTVGYARMATRKVLSAHLALLQVQGREKEGPELLMGFLAAAPAYLKDPADWVWSELIAQLQKQGRMEEALRWGKLSYRLCGFNKDEIEKSALLLNKLWASQEDFAAVRIFNKAQTDPSVANPLANVKLPTLSPEARASLKKQVEELEGRLIINFNMGVARDIVSLRLLLGTPDDLREAMLAAQKMLKERPDLQDGTLQVCRVFKATDMNLMRANAFLAYLEGEGKNPIPEFLKELGATGASPAKP